MLRGCLFFGFAAAIWGLLPLLVRHQLGLGPEWFGVMLAGMGIGAVGAGFVLPHLRNRLDRPATVTGASLLCGASLLLLGLSWHWSVALIAMLGFGAAWISGASTLQAATQLSSPPWVRARALGIYQVATFGALALGTALGGWAGGVLGLPLTLGLAGLGAAAGALLGHRLPIDPAAAAAPVAERPQPSPEPADPQLAPMLAGSRNQLMEVVRYHIAPADRAVFLRTMAECRWVRMRSGALIWRLCEDVAHAERWVELWTVENWTDHLREQERLTEADRAVLARAAALHRGAGPPEAARYLTVMPDMFR
jgi:MFS family permease